MALAIPLVLNNDTWKSKYQGENALRMAADAKADLNARNLDLANIAKTASESALNRQVTELQNQLAQSATRMADLRSQLGTERQKNDASLAQLNRLAAAAQTSANIIQVQGEEITRRRDESLAISGRNIELEDQLRDSLNKLDVALDAQRILQEQIVRLNETLANLGPSGTPTRRVEASAPAPTIESPLLTGRVMSVEQGPDGTRYVEVNLGSRDGVKENMKFMLARGGRFLGNLIISKVELNRAVGWVELEQDQVSINDEVRGGI
jgi:hypothetical protein